MNEQDALGLVRHLIALGQTKEVALSNPAIPDEYRNRLKVLIEREENIILEPVRFLTEGAEGEWFQNVDRSQWYYWPTLRGFLLSHNWSMKSVRSLDDATDRILRKFHSPSENQFDVRGLVLGYVQSGKTANFTATIAKAADCGYRLFIVLSGIDKGLRMQTQARLNREITGEARFPGDSDHVPYPPSGKQWHSFTTADVDGDFKPGSVSQAALRGPEPVMIVVKKNGAVLRHLIRWLNGTSREILADIATLVVDDEADMASIDTKGTYQTEDEPLPPDYESPSVINGLIRKLLNIFPKSVYIAYTATPFANVLIPHDTHDPSLQNDLYPRDFIADLPKPLGYFGAEELFGLGNPDGNTSNSGIDVIRQVPDNDIISLENKVFPRSLEDAIIGFILSGAARAQRGDKLKPATMLIHTSHRIESHMNLEDMVKDKFSEFKNDWRYNKENSSILPRLRDMWELDFRPLIQTISQKYDTDFEDLKKYIDDFLEAVIIKTLNSFTGTVLDYSRDPYMKTICIGGNKLSRGLTLEGLVSSYFVRDSPNYDTLMQMARWFGFREGYADLTRIWTTGKLADEFALLAFVEHQLRDDIRVYEDMQLTPRNIGMRIWQHPSMQVTSYLKRRYASLVKISQSYSGTLVQTFKFPFDRPDILAAQQDQNLRAIEDLISRMGKPTKWENDGQNRPVWKNVPYQDVLNFLSGFVQDDFPERSACDLNLVRSYISHQIQNNELTGWTVSIRGRESLNEELGVTSWKVQGFNINQISRTRITATNSLGVITSPGDEAAGFNDEELEMYKQNTSQSTLEDQNRAARRIRSPEEGLLLIYPISRNSRPSENKKHGIRSPLFANEKDENARDILAVAISFPYSRIPQSEQIYITGIPGWRNYYERP
jgi:hypothetical protein